MYHQTLLIAIWLKMTDAFYKVKKSDLLDVSDLLRIERRIGIRDAGSYSSSDDDSVDYDIDMPYDRRKSLEAEELRCVFDELCKQLNAVKESLEEVGAPGKVLDPAPSSPSVCSAMPLMGSAMCASPSRPRLHGKQDGEPENVLSPSKRHRGKQPLELIVRRSSKLCQMPACCFNRSNPGTPAVARDSMYCIWCDDDRMKAAMGTAEGLKNIRVSLSIFEEKSESVFQAAMQRLPADFNASEMYCSMSSCVYNEQRPGEKARTPAGRAYCVWCDADAMNAALQTDAGRARIRQSLSMFEKRSLSVFEQAGQRLPEDFVRTSLLCTSKDCVFSLSSPGERARARANSHLCAWCDPHVVSSRETSGAGGLRKITNALNTFAKYPAVRIAAYAKLSVNCRTAPQSAADLKRERRAMLQEDLVRACAGRQKKAANFSPRLSGTCELCCVSMPPLRDEVKEFELVVASIARGLGEAKSPIEMDADWFKICCSGEYWRTCMQFKFLPAPCFFQPESTPGCYDYICNRCSGFVVPLRSSSILLVCCVRSHLENFCHCDGGAGVTRLLSRATEAMAMRNEDTNGDPELSGAPVRPVNMQREQMDMQGEDCRKRELDFMCKVIGCIASYQYFFGEKTSGTLLQPRFGSGMLRRWIGCALILIRMAGRVGLKSGGQ